MMKSLKIFSILLVFLWLSVACRSLESRSPESGTEQVSSTAVPTTPQLTQTATTRIPATAYADYEMVTLLPRDAIPAIFNPTFLSAAEADSYYDADELIIGVFFNGEARAYSVPYLSSHEIVNDSVGGVKIAVTW